MGTNGWLSSPDSLPFRVLWGLAASELCKKVSWLNEFRGTMLQFAKISGVMTITVTCRIDDPVLKVEEELWEESMPLRGGSRIYKLEGLKPYSQYEVKISYPASVCS